MLRKFPRLTLEQWPTPIHELTNYGILSGLEKLYIKRDDLNLYGFGGNKMRKMEYWLGEALANGCDVILVAGGIQSNLVRLTAAACAKVGIKCVVIHNGYEPAFYQGNALLNHLYGAECHFMGSIDEEARGDYTRHLADQLRQTGHKPYIINDEFVGTLGYTHCAQEIAQQSEERHLGIEHVVIVGAMGFTAAGFIYGNLLLAHPFKVHVISVEYPLVKLHDFLERNLKQLAELTGIVPPVEYPVVTKLYDQWMGEGWGKTTEASLQAIRDLAANEGIIIDHVYNAKVFASLHGLVKQGAIKPTDPTCIIHTGGGPAFFGYAELFQPQK